MNIIMFVMGLVSGYLSWIIFPIFVLGIYIGYKVGFAGGYSQHMIDNPTPCVHGHTDWNECQVCGH
jgi:hypothetical protein